MPLTNAGLEMMGFRTVIANGDIRAQFFSLRLYQIHGLQLTEKINEQRNQHISGCDCKLAISDSLEEIIGTLIGDDWIKLGLELPALTDDKAPLFGILIKTDDYSNCDDGRKYDAPGDVLMTHRCFQSTIAALQSSADRVTPQIMGGIVAALGVAHATVEEVGTSVYGRTDCDELVIDINPEVNFKLSSCSRITAKALTANFDSSIDYMRRLRPKTSRLFLNALTEKDGLKRFLYFFFAIEVEINDRFNSVKPEELVKKLLAPAAGTAAEAAVEVLQRSVDSKHHTLADKLIWCANSIWPEVDAVTIEKFREMKKIRDDIAHGKITNIPNGAPGEVESLARTLILRPIKFDDSARSIK